MMSPKTLSTIGGRDTAPARIDPETLILKAIETGQSVDTIERLLALRERLQTEYSATEYRRALQSFQQECPKIKRDTPVMDRNGTERYRYATLENILDVARPILHKNGFAFDFDTCSESGAVTVIMTVSHAAGHERQSRFRVPIDPKAFMSEPQKYESAMSFAQRIVFRNGFGIMTGQNDTNTEPVEPKARQAQTSAHAHEQLHYPPQEYAAEPPIGSGTPAHRAIFARLAEYGVSENGSRLWCEREFGTRHFSELTHAQQRKLIFSIPGFAVSKLRRQIAESTHAELAMLARTLPAWMNDEDRAGFMLEIDERMSALAQPPDTHTHPIKEDGTPENQT